VVPKCSTLPNVVCATGSSAAQLFIGSIAQALENATPPRTTEVCAFWPDTSAKSFDKRNVRDGHYPIWGPLHMIARVDGSGIPIKAGANRFLSIVSGAETIKGVSLISTLATRSLVPNCAMRVTRKADGGELTRYAPERSCGCYFEEKATGVSPPAGCKVCATNPECPSTAPNRNKFEGQTSGYCEP
jgi:hypothetical protein